MEIDLEAAVAHYRQAAEAGYARAMGNLGGCYSSGTGVEKDEEAAFQWFLKGAQAGDLRCMYVTGWNYANGCGVSEDISQAIYWFTQGAERGDAKCMCNLGFAYDYGEGVPADRRKAIELYQKAAQLGNEYAMNNLGDHYIRGVAVAQDFRKAAYWLEQAIEQGYSLARYNLGYLYEVQGKFELALEQYHQAEQEGNINACWALGRFYECGRAADKDLSRALHYYKKGAQQADTNCACRMARCLAYGIGTQPDSKQALALCREILEREYPASELEDYGTREELEMVGKLMHELENL